jgi:AraC-like DNA-binding protein
MDIISIIILLGIVQGFFVGLLYITKKSGNIRANKFVGVLFLTFSISIMHFFFHRMGIYYEYPHLFGISMPVLFLFGPLFFFYVKLLINKNYQLKKEHLFHLLPFIFCIIIMIPSYFRSGEQKLKEINYMVTMWGTIISFIQIVHLFAYNTAIYKIVGRHKELIKRSESSIEKIDLHWIQNGIICFVVTFGLMLVLMVMALMGIDTMETFHVLIPLIVSFIIFTMGYLGLNQTDIPVIDEELSSPIQIRKYEKSTLKDDKADEYVIKIKDYMDKSKPYLDNELSLQKLSDKLCIHTHHLSQIINDNFNQNFFDFINSYRVEEAKRLLCGKETSQYTVLAVAEEAGFNSKTSFNTAFKKFTGMTPSEFRKQNPIENQNK